jgi:putative DNA primase/helicase
MSIDPYHAVESTPEQQVVFQEAQRKISLVGSPTSDLNASPKAEASGEAYDDTVKRLAALPHHEYDRVRAEEAKALQVRVTTLDDAVKALALRNQQDETGSPFAEVEPYPDPINPAALLDDLSATILRFIVLDTEQAHTAALWIAVCWFVDVIHCAPIGLINAPEKACGKTQLLSVIGKLVPRAAQASGISPSVLFRMIEAYRPTLLIDEVETVLTKENEDLRGLVNAGHTRESAYVWRSVAKADDFEPRRFSVWGMKAIAGINADRLAETVTSRSIVINLRKKLPHEKADRLRNAVSGLFDTLKAKLARFALDYSEHIRNARPYLPEALNDRAQDNWEPLLAIAECAGQEWVRRATTAALKLSGASDKVVSTGNELLADIEHVFHSKDLEKISTSDLIKALCEDDESAWPTYNRGKPISARQIASRLAGYGIKSKTIRLRYETAKGFEVEQFEDAFARYLADPQNLPSQRNILLKPNNDAGFNVTDSVTCDGYKGNTEGNVTDRKVTSNTKVTLEPAPALDCYRVTDKKPLSQGSGESVLNNAVSKQSVVMI